MDRFTALQSPKRHENGACGLASVLTVGLAAGLAGGLAEIVWIGFYDLVGGVSSRAVAGEIARTLGLGGGAWASEAAMGVVIHLLVAALLGIALVAALRLPRVRITDPATEAVAVVGILATIWAFNFHILGPVIAPDFIALLPASVGLTSKFLFGLSAAAVLMADRRQVSAGGEKNVK